ncbi:E3 ubiquitin-protein ligase RHA2A [Mercurialis annua]|uniref:E3 ubiquitin-protein ligase RHA2A n=1 Tax=Mercurialis annua TaxID=3986 RepID=UPI002160AB07|nr:E3 ubiquitin-protein ligase RHA2A [Mercurialis annua]
MGLQNHLNDVSSDSIPLLLLAIIAKSIDHLRSFLLSLFNSIGFSRLINSSSTQSHQPIDNLFGSSSGLAGLVVLSEQLNFNRIFSYRYITNHRGGGADEGCVVCLCKLRDGDQVRKLDCRHVFHKHCFDGWLDHLNFNCPLCRCPLVSDERVVSTRQRVGADLVNWFSSVR